MRISIKILSFSYFFYFIATMAGKYHNPSLLYCTIGFAYWVLVMKYPIYKKIEDMEDVE